MTGIFDSFDHDDPAHVYSPLLNPSGCDKYYCLMRFDTTGWYAELVTVRAQREEALDMFVRACEVIEEVIRGEREVRR